jgi:RNA polymerase sigma-70 factor (ECF subfamily)
MTREQFITHVEGTQKAFRRFLVALCCGDAALADDIAQEAYIKAYLSCESFNNPDKFNAWIFRIGYTTFINHKRTERIFADYEEVKTIASSNSSDESFRYQDLYQALNELPDKERTSVLLFYMEGYSIKEITEIESTSQDAVKQHLSRGRKHLKSIMSDQ